MKTQFLREKTTGLVNFISKPFIFLRIGPNLITFMSLLTVVGFFFLLFYQYYWLAALMIFLNGVFDLIDGAVARATNKASAYGKFLDRTVDKISDAAILAAFVIFGLVSVPLGLYVIIAMFLATNISANIEGVLNKKISDAVSLRFLRIIILIVLTALQQFYILFIILAVIVTYSLLHRFISGFVFGSKSKVKKLFTYANVITVFRIVVLVPAIVYSVLEYNSILFVIFTVIYYLLDIVDGYLARKFKQSTLFGTAIDGLADLLGIILILLYFYLNSILSLPLIAIIIGPKALYYLSVLFFKLRFNRYANSYFNKFQLWCWLALFILLFILGWNQLLFTIFAVAVYVLWLLHFIFVFVQFRFGKEMPLVIEP